MKKGKTYLINYFTFIRTDDCLIPRNRTCIDWLQDGLVGAEYLGKLKKKYQKKWGKKYFFQINGIPRGLVITNYILNEIITKK